MQESPVTSTIDVRGGSSSRSALKFSGKATRVLAPSTTGEAETQPEPVFEGPDAAGMLATIPEDSSDDDDTSDSKSDFDEARKMGSVLLGLSFGSTTAQQKRSMDTLRDGCKELQERYVRLKTERLAEFDTAQRACDQSVAAHTEKAKTLVIVAQQQNKCAKAAYATSDAPELALRKARILELQQQVLDKKRQVLLKGDHMSTLKQLSASELQQQEGTCAGTVSAGPNTSSWSFGVAAADTDDNNSLATAAAGWAVC